MEIPNLDPGIKERLDDLPAEFLDSKEGKAYSHEIKWYGIEAFKTVYLLKQAQNQLIRGNSPLDEFVEHYDLREQIPPGDQSQVYLEIGEYSLEKDGVYLPRFREYDPNDPLRGGYDSILTPDLRNYFFYDEDWKDPDFAEEVVNWKWTLNSLLDPMQLNGGIKVGKELWESAAVRTFDKLKNGFTMDGYELSKPLPQQVKEDAEELRKYYSQMIYF